MEECKFDSPFVSSIFRETRVGIPSDEYIRRISDVYNQYVIKPDVKPDDSDAAVTQSSTTVAPVVGAAAAAEAAAAKRAKSVPGDVADDAPKDDDKEAEKPEKEENAVAEPPPEAQKAEKEKVDEKEVELEAEKPKKEEPKDDKGKDPSGHVLEGFITQHNGFGCDVCKKSIAKGAHMRGCRPCDWDICDDCFNKQQEEKKEKEESPEKVAEEKEPDQEEEEKPAAPVDPKTLKGKDKLDYVLRLMETEYFGNEHDLYLQICDKYKVKPESEFGYSGTYRPPFVSDLLNEIGRARCSECEQNFVYSAFPVEEWPNGYYMACRRCAPDRDNVIVCKWNKDHKSDAISLTQNDEVATVDASNHKYVMPAGRAMTRGVHCWRWCTRKHSSWCMWGLAVAKEGKYSDYSYGDQGVWGISGSNQCYKNGACHYDVETNHYFNKDEVLIDMKLDLNKGELLFQMPGHATVSKITGLPKDKKEGWLPHINIHYSGTNVQIRKIPFSWFGKNPKRVKFKDT